jgi:hypothetical protein
MIARLEQLYAQEFPYSKIACAISAENGIALTRSAVAGMVRRLGLPKRGPPAAAPFAPVRTPPLPPPPELPRGYTLLDLHPWECKWPVDYSNGAHQFCRETRLEMRSYCATHTKLAYVSLGRRASAAAMPQTLLEPTFSHALD